jgi:hypothetical protein
LPGISFLVQRFVNTVRNEKLSLLAVISGKVLFGPHPYPFILMGDKKLQSFFWGGRITCNTFNHAGTPVGAQQFE